MKKQEDAKQTIAILVDKKGNRYGPVKVSVNKDIYDNIFKHIQ